MARSRSKSPGRTSRKAPAAARPAPPPAPPPPAAAAERVHHPLNVPGYVALAAIAVLLAAAPHPPTWRWTVLACKAAPMLYLALAFDRGGSGVGVRAVGAMVLSLAGDMLLELADLDGHFLLGLCAFAAAHLLYTAAMLRRLDGDDRGLRWAAVPLIAAVAAKLGDGIARCAAAAPEHAGLETPIRAYVGVIGVMLAASVVGGGHGGAATLGAVCFAVSDTVLGWDQFCAPVPYARPIVLTTYFGAQLLLALGLERAE